jgi:Bacterial Ig-like domain (group 2)
VRTFAVACLAIACIFVACGEPSSDSERLQLSPATVTIAAGATTVVTATAGAPVADLVWSSSDDAVAMVTASGATATITGVAPGHATIDAQLGALHASVEVTVVGATLDGITITAARTVIPLGGMEQLTAHGHRTDGTSEDVTEAVTWASQDPSIASVDSHGLVTVRAVGQTAITASGGAARGSLPITVSGSALTAVVVAPPTQAIAKGLAVPVQALGTFSDGSVLDVTAMATWTTSAAAIATVSASGVVQSVEIGSATITATINALTASTAVVVGPPVVTALAITPALVTMTLGTSQQLTVTSTSSDGTSQDATARTTWTVTGTAVTVSATGLAHAAEQGMATITAHADGLTAMASAGVRTPLRLDVGPSVDSPIVVTLAQQQRLQFYARLVFADGGAEDVTATASWSSSNALIAAVVAGRVDAQSQTGTATITAAASGFSVPITAQVTAAICHPVINEALGEGRAASDEWVELYNPCSHAIDVGGYTLVYHGAASGALDQPLATLEGTMAPGAFRLYAGAGYTGTGAAAADGVWAGSNGLLDKSSFGVGLRKPSATTPALVDGVAFGTVVNNPFLEGTAAPGLIGGVAGARIPFDGNDTDDGHRDFSTLIPSPKASNFATP